MVGKKGGSQVNKGLVFLLILLVAVAAFFTYTKLAFTGYVTNIGNATNGATISSTVFDTGDFSNTLVTTDGNVELMPTKTTGTYVSQVFSASQPMIWNAFTPIYISHSSANYTEDPVNNSILFYVRACDDSACTGKDYLPFTGSISMIGQYFQYKAELQILSGNQSSSFSAVNITYYPPLNMPINFVSPLNGTYNNESQLISISVDPNLVNSSTIWFYNGTGNETYTAPLNMTFAEGSHTLVAWTSFTDGNVIYSNSTSLTFSVWFLHNYYRFASNACSQVSIINPAKTSNDYVNLTDCQARITSSNSSTTTDDTSQSCSPIWACENWSDCVDGQQTRICYDTSTCTKVTTEGMPPQTQTCTGGIVTTQTTQETATPVTETPTETTQAAPSKSFLSIVGSVVSAPIKSVTGTVISVVVLVALVGGFVAFKLSKKKTLGAFFNSIGRGIKGKGFDFGA